MSRFAAGPIALVSAVCLGGSIAAQAGECFVDSSAGSLESCVSNARSGDEIVLISSNVVESGTVYVSKDLTFRSSIPGDRASWEHETNEEFAGDPFADVSPFPVQPLLVVANGAEVDLVDLELVPMKYEYGGKNYTLARLISVSDEAEVTARNISVDGIVGAYSGTESGEPGGYVGYVTGPGSTLTFEDCLLRNVEADDHLGGVAFASESGKVLFTGSTVVEWSTAWSGAAAYATSKGEIESLVDGDSNAPTFNNNTVSAFGGVFAVNGIGSTLSVGGGTFHNNFAEHGGSISIVAAGGTVQGARFETNVGLRGGALYAAQNPDPVIVGSGTVFLNNTATESGGALHVESTVFELKDSFLQSNTAIEPDGFAGALFVLGGTSSVQNCRFQGNKSAQGAGGIQYESVGNTTGDGDIEILSSIFLNNDGSDAGAVQVFATTPVNEVIRSNRFCGNSAGSERGSGSILLGGSSRAVVTIENNLFDGTNIQGTGPNVALLDRDYDIQQNTFLRMDTAVFEGQLSAGVFNRNVLTWLDVDVPFVGSRAGDEPYEFGENVWFDPDSRWTATMEVAEEPLSLGPGSVMGDPRFTLDEASDALPMGCDVQDYTLRPDTAALLDGPWDSAGAPAEMAGYWGGEFGPARLWSQDGDGDGVVELWDCDDEPGAGGIIQEGVPEYRDVDGDGFAGELVTNFACAIAPGNSATPDDCDEGNPDTQSCDPDPDPSPGDEVFWYGSGCASSPSGGTSLLFIGLVPLVRRRRRVVA